RVPPAYRACAEVGQDIITGIASVLLPSRSRAELLQPFFRECAARRGSLLIPLPRLPIVLRHALPVFIGHASIEIVFGGALLLRRSWLADDVLDGLLDDRGILGRGRCDLP